MCLVALAVARSERFPWVVAANRDEFFNRPAEPMAWWQSRAGVPPVLGGRDLAAGGGWLALTAAGRLALLTNVREPASFDPSLPSRGDLVLQWLRGEDVVGAVTRAPRNGFNLIGADLLGEAAVWITNRPALQQRPFARGVHGLSNAALDTAWPKVRHLMARVAAVVEDADVELRRLFDDAFAALADPRPAPDAELPATGVPLERERQLSSAFIRFETPLGVYGTRCSTVIVVERAADGRRAANVVERRFDADGRVAGESAFRVALAG